MFYMREFQCVNEDCKHVFEELKKRGEEGEQVAECPICASEAKVCIGNPMHHNHVSWSSWKIGLGK